MTRMNLKEMHERLMLYKMVRQVVEKSRTNSSWEECGQSPWLCNVCEDSNTINNLDFLH